jgi:hypothetical protein
VDAVWESVARIGEAACEGRNPGTVGRVLAAILIAILLVLGALGCVPRLPFLSGQAGSLGNFNATIGGMGWKAYDYGPDATPERSEYLIRPQGHVSLNRYRNQAAAQRASVADAAELKRTDSGNPTTTVIGTYELEGAIDPAQVKPIVEALTQAESKNPNQDLIAVFRDTIKRTGIASSGDMGYAEHYQYLSGNMAAGWRRFRTADDAQWDFQSKLKLPDSVDWSSKMSHPGKGVFTYVGDPSSSHDNAEIVTDYAYVGDVRILVAISGVTTSNAPKEVPKVVAVMKALGY